MHSHPSDEPGPHLAFFFSSFSAATFAAFFSAFLAAFCSFVSFSPPTSLLMPCVHSLVPSAYSTASYGLGGFFASCHHRATGRW